MKFDRVFFFSGLYLYQKHLLYRGTTNNEVTSEQNINSISVVRIHKEDRVRKNKTQRTKRSENMPFTFTSKSFCENICFGQERCAGKGDKMRHDGGKKS